MYTFCCTRHLTKAHYRYDTLLIVGGVFIFICTCIYIVWMRLGKSEESKSGSEKPDMDIRTAGMDVMTAGMDAVAACMDVVAADIDVVAAGMDAVTAGLNI